MEKLNEKPKLNRLRSIFCKHNYGFPEVQPFTDRYGSLYIKYTCTKCGKDTVINEYDKFI